MLASGGMPRHENYPKEYQLRITDDAGAKKDLRAHSMNWSDVDRLRQASPGHMFDVITNGFGAMPDYAAQVAVRDRWAIAAYLRALQNTTAAIGDIPAAERTRLEAGR